MGLRMDKEGLGESVPRAFGIMLHDDLNEEQLGKVLIAISRIQGIRSVFGIVPEAGWDSCYAIIESEIWDKGWRLVDE